MNIIGRQFIYRFNSISLRLQNCAQIFHSINNGHTRIISCEIIFYSRFFINSRRCSRCFMIKNNGNRMVQTYRYNHPRLNLIHQIFDTIGFNEITFFDDNIAFDGIIQAAALGSPQQSR